ncbi:synaptobrevin, longin-like domain protein [Tanacetum coccineum]
MSQPANDDYSQHLSDDEASYHEEASDSGTATNKPKQQQQQLTPTTTTISNIKLLNSEEGGKRISTGKDGVVRILPPVSAAEIHAVENERKARIILLKAIPKEHLRRFHGMDDAKEIWEAIRIRFGGNANSKKMQKALTFQANEIYAKDEKLKRYRRIGMKAVKEKEQLKKTVDSWKDSSKNLWKLIDSGIEFLLGKLLRPIDRNTAKMSYFNAVKGNWGTTVKTTAGYNWRNSKLNSNCDSGPTFIRTMNAKGPQGRPKPEKAWCKKQTIVATSTIEAEYVAAASCRGQVLWIQNQIFKSGRPMLILVGFLKKPEGSAGFEQIVDFLKGTHIRYALEHNPTIYVSVIKQFWHTVTVITLDNGEQELKATIDTHEYTISESSVRNKLKLADENGITELTNAEIFEGMANLGYPIDNTFMFWKKHFTPNWKFMVHHILHCISSKSGGWDQFGSKLATALILSKTTRRTYKVYQNDFRSNGGQSYQLTKKIFGNMNRGFAGVNRPLLANMIAGHDNNQGEPQEEPIESQPPPTASIPSTSQPTTEPHPDQELETETELHGSSSDFVHTPPTQVETSSPELKSISPELMEQTYDQPQPSPVQQPASPEPQPTSPAKSPPLQGPTSTYAEATRINVADLLHLVPQLVTRIDHLEKELKEHKQTTAAVIVKLVKRVKKLETRVKYGNLPTRQMVLSDSESEDAANSSKQGRNLGEEDVFETPKGKDSGETDISPSGLQAAETLVQSFKSASEEIKSGFTNISSGEVRVSQRKGKEVLEEQPQPKRSKRQIREEEASLAEIARIQAQEAAEIERKAELQRLDALAAKRLNDEMIDDKLYRKSYLSPWLRCVGPIQANGIIHEIHQGSCGMHVGPQSVVSNIMKLGYYWPSMHNDAKELIQRCEAYQIYSSIPRKPKQEMTSITSAWPFS